MPSGALILMLLLIVWPSLCPPRLEVIGAPSARRLQTLRLGVRANLENAYVRCLARVVLGIDARSASCDFPFCC